MDFDQSFKGPKFLSGLFPRNHPNLMPQTQTLFPLLPSSSSPSPPFLYYPNNTINFFQNHVKENVPAQNPPFLMNNGPSNPITSPMYGIPIPSLGGGSSFLGGFGNIHRRHSHHVASTPNIDNKMKALYDHHKGSTQGSYLTLDRHKAESKWNFPQETMMIYDPFGASSSKSPSPLSLSNVYERGMREYYHQNVDWEEKMKNDADIANNNIIKGHWTSEEDSALVELVNRFGPKKWSEIEKLLHGRIGKQCRERWHNHLQPNIKKGRWTEEEDNILVEAHMEFGNRWAKIANRLHGRTENTIKNHWNCTKRHIKHNKNNQTSYEDSKLHAYIKKLQK